MALLLNCDLGESFGSWKIGMDEEVFPHIDQANIACGFHGGDPVVLAHADEAAALRSIIDAPTKSNEVPVAIECRLRTSEGKFRWFDITTRDFSDDPEVGGVVVTARDVNEERAAKIGLRRSEEWFRGLVQNSSDVIAVLDEDGVFTYASPAAAHLTGFPPSALRGRTFMELLPADDQESIDRVRRAIRSSPPGVRNLELSLERPDLSRRTAEVTITDLRNDPSVSGLVLNIRDVTDRKRLEEDLRHQVLHDDLTGLGSRVQFSNQLQAALSAPRRAAVPEHTRRPRRPSPHLCVLCASVSSA